MSQIPPFGYVIVQNVQVQRETAIDKERQLRREQAVEKDIAAQEDTFDHHVESTKAVHPVNDQDEKKQPQRQPKPGHGKQQSDEDGETPRLDLTA